MSIFFQQLILLIVKWFIEELNKKDKTESEELGEKMGLFAKGIMKNLKFEKGEENE